MSKALFSFEVWFITIVNGTEYPSQHPYYRMANNAAEAEDYVKSQVQKNDNEVIILKDKTKQVSS